MAEKQPWDRVVAGHFVLAQRGFGLRCLIEHVAKLSVRRAAA